jgi:putative sigma-54 modulation protein
LDRYVARRFRQVARQVSGLATLELELIEERNPAIADGQVCEATLHLKGTTLRAREASPDMKHTVHLVAENLSRQVKRHTEKRRKRRVSRRFAERFRRQQSLEAQ